MSIGIIFVNSFNPYCVTLSETDYCTVSSRARGTWGVSIGAIDVFVVTVKFNVSFLLNNIYEYKKISVAQDKFEYSA